MTSSSSCSLVIRQGSLTIAEVRLGRFDVGVEVEAEGTIDGSRSFVATLERDGPATDRLQLLLGDEVLLVLHPGQNRQQSTITTLRDDWGLASIRVEEYQEELSGPSVTLATLLCQVEPAPQIRDLYRALIEDLETVHHGLVQDVIGRTSHRRSWGDGRAERFDPITELQRLRRLARALGQAIAQIGKQPSRQLIAEDAFVRWRPGDRVRQAHLGSLARSKETVMRSGTVRALGRARVLRPRLDLDTPEHRALRAGVLLLCRRALLLSIHCGQAIELYEQEASRWGRRGSVFLEEYAPRQEALGRLAEGATAVERQLDALMSRHPFLADASSPRTSLAPTPIFLNRPGYREAYECLRELDHLPTRLLAGEDLLVRFRSLSRLYEYWCFLATVWICIEVLGRPERNQSFELVDGVHRPDITPGQTFTWRLSPEQIMTVTYEPDLPPFVSGREAAGGWRAALSSAPLRPDILIVARGASDPPIAMVLDAKSGAPMDRDALWAPSDYRSRVFDPETGHQPVRQVWFLERHADRPVLESLPGYLQGHRGNDRSSVLGVVPFLPGHTDKARRLIERFVAMARGLR